MRKKIMFSDLDPLLNTYISFPTSLQTAKLKLFFHLVEL